MKHTVYEYPSPSGASGLVIDTPGSAVLSIQIRFNSGFQFGDLAVYEVPHVMEHLLATATQPHPGPNEYMIEAQKNGAYVNASTSVDANAYIYEFAAFELERMLDLIEEQLTQPLFDPTLFAAEIGNVREELSRNTTNHGAVCSVELGARAYPRLWRGFDERLRQLSDITLEQVSAHYGRTHTAVNARWFVAGSFDDRGEAVAKRLNAIMMKLARGVELVRSREIGHNVASPVVLARDIQQVYYRSGWYFGELSRAERAAFSLLRLVLVGGMGSRVYGEARRRGLAYGVGIAAHTETGNSSFGFSGYVTPPNAKELFKLAARELAAVQDGKVTALELEAAKNLGIGSVQRSLQTPGDLLGWYQDPYAEDAEIRDIDDYLAGLRQITPAQVAAVAQRVSGENRFGVGFVGVVDETLAGEYAELIRGR